MFKKLICLLFCTMILAGFAGCWQVVHVTDLHGNPIEGVRITTTYQKGYIGPSGPGGTTNKRGNAYMSIASPWGMCLRCCGKPRDGLGLYREAGPISRKEAPQPDDVTSCEALTYESGQGRA